MTVSVQCLLDNCLCVIEKAILVIASHDEFRDSLGKPTWWGKILQRCMQLTILFKTT